MIHLVVNADDAGVDSARNRGILYAFKWGIVRSASVVAGFPAAAEFLKAARRARTAKGERLGIGLHFNLTEGAPLAAGLKSLAGEDGLFLGKMGLWRRALSGGIDPAEVKRELLAQWDWLTARAVPPDHLDGHNHVHVLPVIAEAIASDLPEGRWIRLPREGPPAPAELGADPEAIFRSPERLSGALAEMSERAERLWKGRLRSAERFLGLSLVKGYGPEDLLAALGPPAGGTFELMVHPGEIDASSVPFSALPERVREVQALTSLPVLDFLRDRGVILCSFGGLP